MAAANPSPSEQAASVFALYGLEPSFEIDVIDLEDRLRQASLAWHPDRFALQGEEARLKAEDKMVDFNNAFPMLANPAKRAELLLNWLGASPTQGTDAEADPAFLMQMMELREEAEEVQAAASQNPTPALEFITRMREAESQLLAHFAAGFTALSAEAKAQAGSAAANQEDSVLEVRALRRIFYELRYHQRTREQLETTLQPGFNQIP